MITVLRKFGDENVDHSEVALLVVKLESQPEYLN